MIHIAAKARAFFLPSALFTAASFLGAGKAEGGLGLSGLARSETLSEETLPACEVSGPAYDLPKALRESSGLARSARDPGLFWSHNDAGNAPVLFAVSTEGRLGATVRLQGATLEDWEDISSGQCGSGTCLYVGDIGDNSGKRESITIYRLAEPAAGATTSASATAMSARYPNGPRDAEAMFVLSGTIYIVTKGREGPIELYRLPLVENTGEIATLEKVRDLWPAPTSSQDRVTSASASPDGRWVGVRTYRRLYLFPAVPLTTPGGQLEAPIEMDLTSLDEKNGEGLALANDGTVWLSSEANGKEPARMTRLKCALPRPAI